MKAFGTYISKYLVSFTVFFLILLLLNGALFFVTFQKIIRQDYGDTSPQVMLQKTAAAATPEHLSPSAAQELSQNHIWAIYLNPDGQSYWSLDLPKEVPDRYTLPEVALFSKGYIQDYPVFIRNTDDGLLVLGYPKNSYTKLTSNYYSIQMLQKLPFFVLGLLGLDLFCLFFAYFVSKHRIIQNTAPVVSAVETLADGKPVSLHINGELSQIAESINKASSILSRQKEARANWIHGVSHDIRTPLSMIMGYAERITETPSVDTDIREQAEIIRKQSIKIKELIQDLNLVTQLEYEMQPLHKESVHLAKLLRSYMADLLNSGISNAYSFSIEISPSAEKLMFPCDTRLLLRAVNNLVQNSMRHNPYGCDICLFLKASEKEVILSVSDDGVGFSREKLLELEKKPHYMESMDERLDLRHGLGLFIVRQIATAHHGTLQIKNLPKGCEAALVFPLTFDQTYFISIPIHKSPEGHPLH